MRDTDEIFREAEAAHITHLEALNAQLLEALKRIEEICDTQTSGLHPIRDIARAAIQAAEAAARREGK